MIQKYALICLAFFAFIASGFGQTTIYHFPFDTNDFPSTNNASSGTPVFSTVGTLTAGTGTCNGAAKVHSAWNTGDGYRFTADVSEYEDMEFTFTIRTSNTTVGTFIIRASDDLTTWYTIGASFTPTTTCTTSSVSVPVELNNSSSLYIELYKTNNAGNTGNNIRFDDAILEGELASTTYSVTYDGNGNTGGTAPTDANIYNLGDNVIVLGNPNGLVRTGYTFAGWNTAADGNGTPYAPNSSFSITENMTLYAVWNAITDAADWCNIQFPNTTQTITEGDNLDVYAQAYEPGVTDLNEFAGPGLVAWIGYNTVNNNPNTAGWTWVPAGFNVQVGNNDEFDAEIGSGLDPGTYYYASRFQLNGGPFVYGGTGGIWNNDSVQLNVLADQLDFCNVDFPKTATIDEGDNHNVYAQAYEPGITEDPGQDDVIEAWIGYTTLGINYEPWQAGWTWIEADYESAPGNNYQYVAEIGSGLAAGTYYYASRFRLNGSSTYSYGGIQNDNVGNFWNAGTFNNGVLVVEVASCADLFISEYIEGSSNNKYIEIYNPTNAAINLTGYQLRLYANGAAAATSTENLTGTIPAYGTVVYKNSAATIYGGATTNTNVCGFNGDDAIALLNNGNFIDIIGSIGQDPGTAWTAPGYSTLDRTLVRRATVQSGVTVNPATGFPTLNTEWDVYPIDTITYLGSHTSDCQGPTPELQLVDADGIDQNCGYTINYGSQALTTTTDITFDIENIGTADLDITSLSISAGDYTIVSPIGGFTVTPGDSQEVVVRFTPTAIGTRTATLTINNNDANEGTCTVLLTGVGYTPAPNIRVEKNTFAIINNNAPATTGNNTVFAITNVGSTSSPKTYYIRNGNASNPATADLTVNSLVSSNTAEFSITLVNVPSLPVTLSPEEFIEFEITFSPNATTPVTRTGVITVTSTDSSNNPYTFHVEGTAGCPLYSGTIYPTSGPVGTEITITSAQNLTGASATLNGVPLTTVSSSAGELVVSVPLTATLGGALVVQLSNGCSFTNTFTLIDDAIQSCEGSGGSTPSNLFISQVTDSPTGSLTYIELFNGTGTAINFATNNYSLRIYNNGNTTTFNTIAITSGTIAANGTYVIAVGTNDSQCGVTGGNGSLAQQTVSTPGVSINFHRDNVVTLGHDYIGLYNSSATLIDAFGVFGNESWATSLTLGESGANFTRNVAATPLPSTTFSLSDWNVMNWDNCGAVDYSNVGAHDFSVGIPPSVDVLDAPTSDCGLSATLTVTATEGFAGGLPLAYQWYYSAPGESGWTAIVDNAIYNGATTNTLEILNTLSLNGYQYYCQVRESSATCYTASNAVKLSLSVKTWNGPANGEWYNNANWLPVGVPTATDNVVISGAGTPVLSGGIPIPPTIANARTLTVLNGTTLTVPAGQNLIVEECIVNNGSILLENTANLVQNHLGVDMNSGTGSFSQQRIVNDVQNLNYIYWSSPVAGVAVTALPGSGNHRYYWNPTATNANLTQGDWIQATSGVMEKGRGYIIRYSASDVTATFEANGIGRATPHNGEFTVNIQKGTLPGIDDNWNLIGNPYPSAISADAFIMTIGNATPIGSDDDPSVLGTVYLWQHQGTPNSETSPFYQDFQINYEGDNYIAYNVTGVNPPTPQHGFDGYIASGQAFFVLMDEAYVPNSATVTFNNTIRYDASNVAYENNQFLRQALSQQTTERHRIWLDLIAPNQTAISTLVGYVAGATNERDRLFDGYETNATGLGFYSLIDNEKMGIQGRTLPFDDTDTVPLGINILQNGEYTIAINQVDGLFENGAQGIYLEDKHLNIVHDLRVMPYKFQSENGRFNDRFILRYTNSTLSTPDVTVDAGLTIVELSNGHVKFTVGHNLTIANVEIYDMLGRQLYNLPGTNAVEIYNLANLSQAAYVAKVTLSNGQTVTKRAVKRL